MISTLHHSLIAVEGFKFNNPNLIETSFWIKVNRADIFLFVCVKLNFCQLLKLIRRIECDSNSSSFGSCRDRTRCFSKVWKCWVHGSLRLTGHSLMLQTRFIGRLIWNFGRVPKWREIVAVINPSVGGSSRATRGHREIYRLNNEKTPKPSCDFQLLSSAWVSSSFHSARAIATFPVELIL